MTTLAFTNLPTESIFHNGMGFFITDDNGDVTTPSGSLAPLPNNGYVQAVLAARDTDRFSIGHTCCADRDLPVSRRH